MLLFRKMTVEDLDIIYQDIELRPLLTDPSTGTKFGLVIDLDGKIIGGVTGYIDGTDAKIQKLIVKDHENTIIYKDGLIRSLIHTLELDGIKQLFVEPADNMDLYTNIGFEKQSRHTQNSKCNAFYIDLKDFFCEKNC